MQKISPCLWFDTQAEEAVKLYTAVFKDSKIGNTARYDAESSKASGMPVGSVLTVEFQIAGQDFLALNGGPVFKLNPSVSFLVACRTKGETETVWKKLADGGTALMEFGAYPFSEMYGWIQDRYGLSWQVMFVGDNPVIQKITPTFMFVGEQCGKTESAIRFYASVFRNTKIGDILRYGKGEEPDREGTVKHAAFTLEGQEFAAMDSAYPHAFAFNEAVSFVVNCHTQQEIDYYWGKLSAVPESEQCGWLKDKYGLSWQIVPTILDAMLRDNDPVKAQRVMKAMLQMKKIDIKLLKQAYAGR